MTELQKTEIATCLEAFVAKFDSQAKAAAALQNVSESMVIQIRKKRWAGISDATWRVVAKQVGYQQKSTLVETLSFQTCCLYFDIAKEHGETFALIGNSACGKSFAGKWYAKNVSSNAYYIECAVYWNRKYFLQEMIQAMGKSFSGNVYEMMEFIVSELRKQDRPLFILDEIDKLAEPVLLFFITLYNKLNKLCGFVWTSSYAMRTVMNKRINKIGYSELMTRISSFIELPAISDAEKKELCEAAGITDDESIGRAVNESKNNNIRRIDRLYLGKLVRQHRVKSA